MGRQPLARSGKPVAAKQRAKLYKTKRWQQLRKAQLARHPLCQCPFCKGKDPNYPADVVDHIVPHRGDSKLFHDPKNLQSMAKPHHDRFKQSQERGGAGFWKGCGPDGQPLDDSHPWHQPEH